MGEERNEGGGGGDERQFGEGEKERRRGEEREDAYVDGGHVPSKGDVLVGSDLVEGGGCCSSGFLEEEEKATWKEGRRRER